MQESLLETMEIAPVQPVPVSPVAMAIRLAKTARTNRLRLITDTIMILCFLILTLTSIVKMPFPVAWYEYLADKGLFDKFSFTFLAYFHDIAGIVFLVSLGVHLVLNWKRFIWLIKASFK